MRKALQLTALLWLGLQSAAPAEDWPEFRGPTGQGLYAGKALALEWSPTKNVIWKQPIPGRGWSSPIILNGRVYLTTAAPITGSKDLSLQAICLDAATGQRLWATEVFREIGAKSPRIHGKNSHASPTPVTDGKRLFVHFGHEGTAALDVDGHVLWRNTKLRYAPVHGNGGTPILVDDRLVFSADGGDQQFVVALDQASGQVVWKTPRNNQASRPFSFSTPLLIQVAGKPQIISPASEAIMAYNPADGKEIWRVKHPGYSVIPRPVYGHGLVFLSSGYNNPQLLAIRPDGTGDVTTSHVVWSTAKAAPHTPSPLLAGNELYLISDPGFASCLDARTGKTHWKERVGGNFSASPLYADGRIYLQSEEGLTTVLRAGTKYERLAQNNIKEPTLASLAAADGAIFLRTEKHLYRIQAR